MKISLASIILLISGCDNHNPPFTAPQASDVTVIFAELYNEEDIKRFEVQESFYKAILDTLNDAKKDRFPPKWAELGNFDIAHRSGLLEVQLFRTGEPVGAFRANDDYYRGCSDSEFIRFITATRKQQSEQNAAGQPATRPLSK